MCASERVRPDQNATIGGYQMITMKRIAAACAVAALNLPASHASAAVTIGTGTSSTAAYACSQAKNSGSIGVSNMEHRVQSFGRCECSQNSAGDYDCIVDVYYSAYDNHSSGGSSSYGSGGYPSGGNSGYGGAYGSNGSGGYAGGYRPDSSAVFRGVR